MLPWQANKELYKIIIIWIVCAFWLVYKCVFIALWSTEMAWAMWCDCLRVERIYITRFLYRLSLCNNENYNFIKEIKHVFCASIACWKPGQSLCEFSSRWKPLTASRIFTDLLSNSPKHSPRFSPGYEGKENMFYLLNIYEPTPLLSQKSSSLDSDMEETENIYTYSPVHHQLRSDSCLYN